MLGLWALQYDMQTRGVCNTPAAKDCNIVNFILFTFAIWKNERNGWMNANDKINNIGW